MTFIGPMIASFVGSFLGIVLGFTVENWGIRKKEISSYRPKGS